MGMLPDRLSRREFAILAGGAAAVLVVGGGLAHGSHSSSESHPSPGLLAHGTEVVSAPAGSGTADSGLTLEELPWNLRLVNGTHPLPEGFEPPERCDIPGTDGLVIDRRVLDDLMALLDGAAAAGVRPEVCSAYRSHDYQERLFAARVQRAEQEEGLAGADAEEAASFWVARPGASEHEAAFAVDLVDASYQELDEAQEATDTQRWLIDHCAEYGFILRYPTDKSDVTGIGYEPWHYRYVGKEAAGEITASGLCLEEWIESCGWDTAA